MGFTTTPGASLGSLSGYETEKQSESITETIKAVSGMMLPWEVDGDISFNRTYSWTNSTTSITEKISTSFPELKLTWGKIAQFEFFKKYASSARAQSAFNYTATTDKVDHKQTGKSKKFEFAPVFSLNVTWRNGIQTSAKIDYDITDSDQTSASATTKRLTNNLWEGTIAYNVTKKNGLTLPIIGKVNLDNTLKLQGTITYTHKKNQELRIGSSGKPSIISDVSDFMIKPSATYNFSKNIDATFSFIWYDSKDLRLDIGRHRREVDIKVTLKF